MISVTLNAVPEVSLLSWATTGAATQANQARAAVTRRDASIAIRFVVVIFPESVP